jgi:hypothetical protein
MLGVVPTTHATHSALGPAIPLPRGNIGQTIAAWTASAIEGMRTKAQSRPRRSKRTKPYHHPSRESFIEEAAMSREMFRL